MDLSQEQWERIDALYEEALALPVARREAFVREQAGAQEELAHEVLALLAYESQAEKLLGDSIGVFAGVLIEEMGQTAAGTVPDRIGGYTVLREIGRGGMGTVYLAQADRGIPVAIKQIKRGMDSDDIIRRFHYERHILSRLDHPQIARLLDGGVDEDGRPFFVMEYVDGMPIDVFSDTQRYTIEQRLGLFVRVCEAVRYAHANVVVHRDLKPSNMLVTHAGDVKLLDFGIAKMLDAQEGPVSIPRTKTDARVLTPEYASPEQLRGEAVTTAVDVFALGVVLYELLTGRRPGSGGERPSQVVTRNLERRRRDGTSESLTPQVIGTSRQISADRLRRRLEGDLDTITLKALNPEVQRRYASAEAFLEDIKRHLTGLPVTARPDTSGYRAWKFVQRHRFSVATGVLIACLLAAFVVSTVRQQRVTATERDKAEEVATFLETLFAAADPLQPETGRPDTLRARDLLARGVTRIENDLGAQPAIQASLFTVIGTVYSNLGLYEAADSLLSKGLMLRLGSDEQHPLDIAESQFALAGLRVARSDPEAAELLYRNAVAIQRAAGAREPLLKTLLGLAYAVQLQGSFDEAETLLKEAVALSETLHGARDAGHLDVLQRLALLYEDVSNYREAEALLRQVLAAQRETFGERNAKVASTLNNLSLVLRDQELFAEAEVHAREAAVINAEVFGADHPSVGANLENVGAALIGLERYEAAEAAYRSALSIFRSALGEDHSSTQFSLTHLAELMRKTAQYDEAAHLYAGVIARTLASDPDNPGIGIVSALLANVYLDARRFSEADSLYRFAIDRMSTAFPGGHIRIGRAYYGLGKSLTGEGRYDEAEASLNEALAIFTAREQHVELAREALEALQVARSRK